MARAAALHRHAGWTLGGACTWCHMFLLLGTRTHVCVLFRVCGAAGSPRSVWVTG